MSRRTGVAVRPVDDVEQDGRGSRTVSAPASGLVFVDRSLRQSLRDGEGIVMAIVMPVVLMLLFTFIFGGALAGGNAWDYLNYVVPGVLILCATQGSASVATAVARDLSEGVMRRFRTMPIVASTVLVGHIVAGAVRNLVASAVVIGVAVAIGYRPAGGLGDFIGAILAMGVFIAVMNTVMATIGLLSGTPENAAGYGFIFFVLPYLSSGFVRVETMPGWLQPVADHQPFTYYIEVLRCLLDGTAVDPSLWWGFGLWTIGLLLIGAAVSGALFGRKVGR